MNLVKSVMECARYLEQNHSPLWAKDLLTICYEVERLRLRCKRQRAELRRLNKVLGPYWRGVSYGACFERVCALRSKMIAAFGGQAVFEAEHGKKEEGEMSDIVERLRDKGLVLEYPERERIAAELEHLRPELEDYHWLCTVPLAIDTTGDPDNFVHIWLGSPEKRYSGRNIEEAIRNARNAESAPDPRPDAKT